MEELIEYIRLHEKDILNIFDKINDKTGVEIQNLYHQIVKAQIKTATCGLIFGLIILIVSSILIFLITRNNQIDSDARAFLICGIIVVGGLFGTIITVWNLISLIEWINEPTLKVFEHIKYMLS